MATDIVILKRKRTLGRRIFSNAIKKFQTDLEQQRDIPASYKYVEDKAEELFTIEAEIKELLFQGDDDDETIFADLEGAETYRQKLHEVRAQYESIVQTAVPREAAASVSGCTVKCMANKTFRLPTLELKKFDGQPINWITFWGQYKRIHEDLTIDDFDKFRYLIQATEPFSKARDFVESFPPLESLGVTSDKYAAMLLPMVETTIPFDVLKAWERSRDKGSRPQLTSLMEYLKAEVESEERISIAKRGFDATHDKQPTASCLTAAVDKKPEVKCLFCEKTSHHSIECPKLFKLTLEEKRDLLRKHKACFICLRVGHGAKSCRSFTKCLICSRRHLVVMCPQINEVKKDGDSCTKSTADKVKVMTCTRRPKTTFLQTVLVKLSYNGKSVVVRAFFDSGAQRSYVRENVAKQLGMKVASRELMSHSLFGGLETKADARNVYEFSLGSVDGQYQVNMKALGQEKICGSLPRLMDSSLQTKLRDLNIYINDSDDSVTDIGLLIGADISGLILNGHIVHIDGSLVAIDTKLGWTLQGQAENVYCTYSLTEVACFVGFSVSDLWDLEVMGIREPSEVKSKEMCECDTLKFFSDTVTRDPDGRYQVHLPWKEGFPENLPFDNRNLAYKRLVSTTKKLKQTGNLDRYDKVFKDWFEEGIIERVIDGDSRGLYLYHHAVIKESSATTPVRPVFDASAKLQGHSLNSSLEKGTNLLELLPKLLMGFRKNTIGITADVRKAFLQISVVEKDRDYLRFLWWSDLEELKTPMIYRHKRVVFGVTSSSFLLAAAINHHLDSIHDDRRMIAQQLKASLYVDNCVHSLNTDSERERFVEVSTSVMTEAQFDLRGWVYGPCEMENSQSVLGLRWNNKEDVLRIEPEYRDLSDVVTKRINPEKTYKHSNKITISK